VIHYHGNYGRLIDIEDVEFYEDLPERTVHPKILLHLPIS